MDYTKEREKILFDRQIGDFVCQKGKFQRSLPEKPRKSEKRHKKFVRNCLRFCQTTEKLRLLTEWRCGSDPDSNCDSENRCGKAQKGVKMRTYNIGR